MCKVSINSVARSMGVSASTVSRAVNGSHKDPITAILIHYHSQGVYPCWQLRPDLWSPGYLPPRLVELLEPKREFLAAS